MESQTSSRQVIDALLRGKSAARVGVMEGFWADTFAKWVRQGYPTRKVYHKKDESVRRLSDGMVEKAPADGEYEEPVAPWEHFALDMTGVGGWFDWKPLRGCDELVSETAEWEIRRNGAGASYKFWKHKMGTPEHMDFRMTTREIWERDYRPLLLDFDPLRVNLAEQQRSFQEASQTQVWRHFGHMFVWEMMRQSMGDVTLYSSLLLDPAWIHDFCQVYTAFFKAYFAYLFANVGIPDGVWIYEDMGYNAGLFASPKTFRELIFPYYRELVAYFHSLNLPVVLHSCGSVAQILPEVVEAGFDALNPMERKAKNNDPFAFAEKYGEKLAFVGGFDVRILETNDAALVRKEVAAYVEGMKARGARLVFGSDHSIPPTVDYDTYRLALDVYRQHMAY
ncbi:MAG TPA: uroporphyrinogen decarboxylase family protein [Anaerolineaceae bacterium]